MVSDHSLDGESVRIFEILLFFKRGSGTCKMEEMEEIMSRTQSKRARADAVALHVPDPLAGEMAEF